MSKMSSGKRWQDYVDHAIACPDELPFGTKITVDGRTWECMDRGGAIVKTGNVYWIDMLSVHALYPFGEIKDAIMVLP